MPRSVPANRTWCPRAVSSSATARPGNKWPPVPPPAMIARIVSLRRAAGGYRRRRVARAQRRSRPAPHEQREHQRHAGDADETELLADDGHDVVGVRFGQEEELLLAVAEAEAEHAARADRDERLGDLIADVEAKLP